jgi:hypothetical protein
MKLRLSSDAVERILRATGIDFDDGGGPPVPPEQKGSPPFPGEFEPPPPLVSNQGEPLLVDDDDWMLDLDLGALLRENVLNYYGAVQRRSDRKKRDRIRRLREVSKVASRLQVLLKPDSDWEWTQDSENEFLVGQIDLLKTNAQRELDDLKLKLEWGDDANDMPFGESLDLTDALRTRSPFDWLVGEYLPQTFKKFFGEEPTLNRRSSDGKLHSKYLRFAEQVLIEFGITKNNGQPYELESIAKAFSLARGGRTRRRSRR